MGPQQGKEKTLSSEVRHGRSKPGRIRRVSIQGEKQVIVSTQGGRPKK